MHRITIANHLSSWSPDLTDRSNASLFFFKILVAMSGSGQLWSEVKLKHKYITVSRRPHFLHRFLIFLLCQIVGLKIWKTESSWITFSVSDYCVVYVLFNIWKFWSSEFDFFILFWSILLKFGKNANFRQLWTQLPNSVKFFLLDA